MLKFSKTEFEVFDEIKKSDGSNKPRKIEDGQLYEQALGLVIRNKKISINQLRKLFNVGYKRAKGVIEQLEKNNIIESYAASGGSRVIKVSKEKLELMQKEENEDSKKQSFHYVNHILKIPSYIQVIEEDVL